MTKMLVLSLLCLTGLEADLKAIWEVESSCRLHPPDGDNGRSIGPFQISRDYWIDSRVPGTWEQCRDYAYARKVVLAYWKRYRGRDSLDRARLHNGGPSRRATADYIRRFKIARGIP